MKKCTKCKKNKDEACFNKKSENKKTGLDNQCKDCVNERNRNYYLKNLGSFKNRRKKYYQKNLEKMRKEKREYCANNKKRKSEYDIEYRKKNKQKIKQYKINWSKKNKDNIVYKIKRNLRRRIHHVVKDGYKSDGTMNLIGCDIDSFIKHIESQFLDGMSWDNYGQYGWHIDHIKPCSSFDLTDPEQQKECFHYSNQRPLWWIDNLKKSRKLIFE